MLCPAAFAIDVTSSADSGPGTLRAAVAAFPASPDTEIVLKSNVYLTSGTIVYPDSNKKLILRAETSAVIVNLNTQEQLALQVKDRHGGQFEDFAVLDGAIAIELPSTSAGNTDVTFDGVHVYSADRTGILVDVDAAATGDVTIDFLNVVAQENGTYTAYDANGRPNGVLIFDDHVGGTLDVSMTSCVFNNNRRAGCKVWRKNGDLFALVIDLDASFNGVDNNGQRLPPINNEAIEASDGIQFEQEGTGSSVVIVAGADVVGNTEDGIEVEEDAAGELSCAVLDVYCEGSPDEGIAIQESGTGGLIADLDRCDVVDCLDSFKVRETQHDALSAPSGMIDPNDGGLTLTMDNCKVLDGADEDSYSAGDRGVTVQSTGNGNVDIRCNDCSFSYCNERGFRFEPEHEYEIGASTFVEELSEFAVCYLEFGGCTIQYNNGDGIKAESVNSTLQSTINITDSQSNVDRYRFNGVTGGQNLDDTGPWILLGLASHPLINN